MYAFSQPAAIHLRFAGCEHVLQSTFQNTTMSKDNNINNASGTPGKDPEGRLWSAERMQQAIHAYLHKQMSEEQQEEFWEQLILQPAYYEQLRLQASLKKLHQEKGDALFTDDDPGDSGGPPNNGSAPENGGPTLAKAGPGGYTRWILAAAAVTALVLAVNILRVSGPLGDRAQPEDSIASADTITPPLSSIDALYFESIDAYRDEISGERFVRLFDEGLLAAFSGDDEQALRIYEQILQEFPEDKRTAMVQLNAGIIEYNTENYEAARQRFESAFRLAQLHEDYMLQEKALWFTANAELYEGEPEAASQSLEKVIAYNGSFEADAQNLLNTIQPYLEP